MIARQFEHYIISFVMHDKRSSGRRDYVEAADPYCQSTALSNCHHNNFVIDLGLHAENKNNILNGLAALAHQ